MRKYAALAKMTEVFAKNLSACRKAMGITQEQLAEISGFSTNYIARLETGISTPSFATLIKLSESMQIKASDLLAAEYEPAAPSDTYIIMDKLLDSLNDDELEYVLSQLRNSVRFIISHRKNLNE